MLQTRDSRSDFNKACTQPDIVSAEEEIPCIPYQHHAPYCHVPTDVHPIICCHQYWLVYVA